MEEIKRPNLFYTSEADLAAYLYMEGAVLHDLKVEGSKVVLVFEDTKNNLRDLEFMYQRSKEKKHHEFYRWFIAQIHKKLKGESNV